MVKYWGRGLLMLFEPFCKGSARFSNVFFSTPLFIALVSIYDPTLAVNGIIVISSDLEEAMLETGESLSKIQKINLDDQRSSFSLNRTKFSLDHKLSPGLYQGFIRCNGKC